MLRAVWAARIQGNSGMNCQKWTSFFPTLCIKSNFNQKNSFSSSFSREYCSSVKITENNTEFLRAFTEFIDRKTPKDSSCEYYFFIRWNHLERWEWRYSNSFRRTNLSLKAFMIRAISKHIWEVSVIMLLPSKSTG